MQVTGQPEDTHQGVLVTVRRPDQQTTTHIVKPSSPLALSDLADGAYGVSAGNGFFGIDGLTFTFTPSPNATQVSVEAGKTASVLFSYALASGNVVLTGSELPDGANYPCRLQFAEGVSPFNPVADGRLVVSSTAGAGGRVRPELLRAEHHRAGIAHPAGCHRDVCATPRILST
jgi:hypothetical protein